MNSEDRARELGDSPEALEARLREAASCLIPELRARFRRARFVFTEAALIGDGARLVWRLRKWPHQPVSYSNQQTSTGYVALEAA